MSQERQHPPLARANQNAPIIAPLPPGSRVVVPNQMKTVRYAAPKTVEVNGEVPLIHPKDPDERQLQAHYLVGAKIFDLEDPDDLEIYTQIWQDITDGKTLLSQEEVKFSDHHGRYLVFLRWADVEIALPGAPRPPRRVRRRLESPEQEG